MLYQSHYGSALLLYLVREQMSRPDKNKAQNSQRSLMDVYFKTLSSRMIAASWWMFVLLVLSCYSANLAAFLTIDKMDSTINSVEDLLRQNQIKVGVDHENETTLRLLKVFRNNHCHWSLGFQKYHKWRTSSSAPSLNQSDSSNFHNSQSQI